MIWCVMFFYIDTHEPVNVAAVRDLPRAEAESFAAERRPGIYGVARPQPAKGC